MVMAGREFLVHITSEIANLSSSIAMYFEYLVLVGLHEKFQMTQNYSLHFLLYVSFWKTEIPKNLDMVTLPCHIYAPKWCATSFHNLDPWLPWFVLGYSTLFYFFRWNLFYFFSWNLFYQRFVKNCMLESVLQNFFGWSWNLFYQNQLDGMCSI